MADKYIYHLKNGKTMTLEGDTMPSDDEVESIAKQQGVELLPSDTLDIPKDVPKSTPKTDIPKTESIKQPEEGMLSKIWHKGSEPLTDAPSRFAKSVSNYVNPNSETTGLRGIGSAFIEGLGNTVSGLTSPINLGMTALSGGSSAAMARGLPRIAQALNWGSKPLAAGMMAEGAEKIYSGETLPDKLMGGLELAGGGLGMRGVHTVGDSLKDSTSQMGVMPEQVQSNPSMIPHVTHTSGMDEKPLQPPISPKVALPKDDWTSQYIAPKIDTKPPIISAKSAGMPEPTPELIAKSQANGPPVIHVTEPTPEFVKRASEYGYKFSGVTDDGKYIFNKSTPTPSDQLPILRSEVGGARPTNSNANKPPTVPPEDVETSGPIGPKADLKKQNPFAEAWNFPRGVMAAWDFSAPFRQGLGLIHKKAWWTSWDDMFKSFGSEKAFRDVQDSISSRELFRSRKIGDKIIPSFAQDAGLKLTDLTDLSKREEQIMSTWAEKVPGVRPSNRAMTAFVNKLRADTFEDLIKQGKVFGADGTTNLPLAREIASFVNIASGRGSLGPLEKHAVLLNSLLFSPRLIASRLETLVPARYIMANPMVRKEAIKSLFAIAGAGATVTELGKLAGGTVSDDPTSSDYKKLRIGNTRLDPYGGYMQYIVAAQRLLQGKTTSSTTEKEHEINGKGPYDPSSLDIGSRFARGKLHPVLGFAYSLADKKREMSGKKMNLTTPNPMENAITQRFIPILTQDIYEIMKEDPKLLPIAIPDAFGMSSQSYGPLEK